MLTRLSDAAFCNVVDCLHILGGFEESDGKVVGDEVERRLREEGGLQGYDVNIGGLVCMLCEFKRVWGLGVV